MGERAGTRPSSQKHAASWLNGPTKYACTCVWVPRASMCVKRASRYQDYARGEHRSSRDWQFRETDSKDLDNSKSRNIFSLSKKNVVMYTFTRT